MLGMAYVGLDIALGNQGNKLLVNDLLTKNDKLGYMIDQYIDDQSTSFVDSQQDADWIRLVGDVCPSSISDLR